MAVDPTLTQALSDLDAATTAIGVTVTALDQIVSTNMSPADVQTVHDGMAAIAARLNTLAHDPNVPVPPAPPMPVAFKKKP